MADFDTEPSDTPLPNGDLNRRGGRDDESGVARVLRAAGGRALPSDDMKQAVRAAVHAEWRAALAKRTQRRVLIAIAASVALAALGLWVSRPYFASTGEVVASVSRAIGAVRSRDGSFSSWQPVAAAAQLRTGQSLETGSDGRIAVQLRDGVSLRLDHDTSVVFVDTGRVDVGAGAVYVDAGTQPNALEHLRIGTPAGIVRHVGTQYEARLVNGGVRIRVREGRVELLPQHGSPQSAQRGEQLLVSTAGAIERGAIEPNDAEWDWAASAAPAFDINGRPVHAFLDWAGRELGREIVFETPESELEADRAVLSGSVAALAPAEALGAVLPTTRLRSLDRDGKIEISLQREP